MPLLAVLCMYVLTVRPIVIVVVVIGKKSSKLSRSSKSRKSSKSPSKLYRVVCDILPTGGGTYLHTGFLSYVMILTEAASYESQHCTVIIIRCPHAQEDGTLSIVALFLIRVLLVS